MSKQHDDGRHSNPVPRRERFVREFDHDAYGTYDKPPEPAVCTQCGVAFHKGRWQWLPVPAEAHRLVCPACRRINGKSPLGFLTLSGAFLQRHRDEILNLTHNVEAREKAEHALSRIMHIEPQNDDALLVTTTTMELARAIGNAIQHAWRGELSYRYTDASTILRVEWKRAE